MENFNKILSSFNVQENLNPQIWDLTNNKMKPRVRQSLLEIANEFINYLGFDIFVQDITMTGSLANFNWSKFSDIDLHIMFDFNEAKDQKELFAELFKLKKTLFNSTHDLKIKGYEVELYVQDTNEPHISTGIYSVLFDNWISEPEKEEIKIDERTLSDKVNSWTDKIDMLLSEVEEMELVDALNILSKFKEKLKEYRNSGLEKEGEFSYENLVFKFLRRNGYIQKLFDFQNELVDRKLSLDQ
jgi:predicted nucleotidyltransferase